MSSKLLSWNFKRLYFIDLGLKFVFYCKFLSEALRDDRNKHKEIWAQTPAGHHVYSSIESLLCIPKQSLLVFPEWSAKNEETQCLPLSGTNPQIADIAKPEWHGDIKVHTLNPKHQTRDPSRICQLADMRDPNVSSCKSSWTCTHPLRLVPIMSWVWFPAGPAAQECIYSSYIYTGAWMPDKSSKLKIGVKSMNWTSGLLCTALCRDF